MSDARGQITNSYQGLHSIPWGVTRHRVSAADRIGRAISIGRIRIDDFRSRIITPTRARESNSGASGFLVYRVLILTASCVGAAYGVSEFVIAVFGP